MKAFIVDRHGKKGALRFGDMPEPMPRDGDVLVAVHAAGLNVLDSKIRDGAFKPILPMRPPFVLGHDVAGTVLRVGPAVRGFVPGDEIYARPRDGRIGTLAERIAIDAADVALKPKTLSMAEAASLPLVGLTGWQVLVERAGLAAGQKVLVHAGSGGVGTFAIQLAKHLGATVATTTSTANVALVESLGADVVIDYKRQRFEDILSGYDLVIASLGDDTLAKSLRVLKPGGLLVSLSGPPDPAFARTIGAPWWLALAMRAMSAGIRRKARRHGVDYAFHFMRADGAQLARITPLIEAGAIRPVIDRVFPFAQANAAMAHLETGHARGKVVIEVP